MSPRVFLIVCANGRDRHDAQRLGLTVAGVDRVEYVVLATVDRAIRGLSFVGFAITAWAEEELSTSIDRGMLRYALRSRMRPVDPDG